MPKNKKEELIFTCTMAALMVFGMTLYNVFLSNDGNFIFVIKESIKGYPVGLIVALLFDFILVGPLVEKFCFGILVPKYNLENNVVIGIIMSVLMVLGMVSCMSFFGVFVNGFSLSHYPITWVSNLIMALPLQLIIVGPISRTVLSFVQN